MEKIQGLSILRDTKGRIKKITLDYKKHEKMIEDILDNLAVERFDESREQMHDWEDIKTELVKKHRLK